MELLTDEELAAMSIEDRNNYIDNWVEGIHDSVWVPEDEEPATLSAFELETYFEFEEE